MARKRRVRKKLVFLARCRDRYRAELRADFRRYYGCSYSEVERSSPAEAADLAFLLPRGSSLLTAIDPAYAWTRAEVLLATVANVIAAKKGHKPIVSVPEVKASGSCVGMSADDLDAYLNRPREEVI